MSWICEQGLVVIKPSGVSYDEMKADDMVVVDLEGNVVEGLILVRYAHPSGPLQAWPEVGVLFTPILPTPRFGHRPEWEYLV